ncbi:MAG: hypothetical protein M3N49_00070 [Candidatus Eremiobacteraeota bacterium]|nr:hypothetical protein [Candidatus Eremiobacteraeota bacterium]
MSYTQTANLFTAVNEHAINRSFAAVFNARPHLFNYSSIRGGTSTPATVTIVEPIKIPLSTVVLHWSLGIALPQLDLFPENGAPQPPLPPLALDQFLLSTAFAVEVFDPGSTTSGSSGTVPVRAIGEIINAGTSDVPVLGFRVVGIDLAGVAPDALRVIVDEIATVFLQSVVGAVRIPIPSMTLELLTVRLVSPPPHPTQPAQPIADDNAIEAWGVLQ